MTFVASTSRFRSALCLCVCAGMLAALMAGCDFGAAQTALESVSPTLDLSVSETTVSGRAVEASTGALLRSPVDLEVRGPARDAVLDMYGTPLSSPTLYGGSISASVRGAPSLDRPIRFQVVAGADGYQTTSAAVEVTGAGTKEFRLHLLREDPARQPQGATGVRTQIDVPSGGPALRSAQSVVTPAGPAGGGAGLSLPEGTVLRSEGAAVDAPVTVDLIHYSITDRTLDALPGDGVVVSENDRYGRFAAAGYLNRQFRTRDGDALSSASTPGAPAPTMWTTLPTGAVHPSDGTRIEAGDPLALFRFDRTDGTWRPDTILTVRPVRPGPTSKAGARLGLRWPLDASSLSTRWWAWGHRPSGTCTPATSLTVAKNGQTGPVTLRLQRPGLQYTRTVSLDALTSGTPSLATLLEQPAVPRHDRYTLVLRTRDGQSRTVASLSPCGGTQAVSLPAPAAPSARTDVLVQAVPDCPANQRIRITSAPKVRVYYRPEGTPTWHPAGGEHITWVMNDPESPTYIRRAELRLDGLQDGVRYEFRTTYGQDQYEASVLVPDAADASSQNGRTVVSYRHPLPALCS